MTFTELKKLPADIIPLPLEMEQKLAKTLVSKRSTRKHRENAIAMLVHYSMREAFLYAGKCSKGRITSEMLTSLSYLGLCKAAKNFKPGQLRFFSYAKIYVRSEVFRQFRESSVIRNVPCDHIIEIKNHGYKIDPNPDDDIQSIKHPKGAPSVDHQCEHFSFDSIHSSEVWAALLPRIKDILTAKEYFVVTRHYIDDLNFREIGDELGDSRSWAQILHARALKKIRKHRELLKQAIDL